MTPRQLAWRKFQRNIPALLGLGYLCICLLVALLGYMITPDASTHANRQILELAKKPPGTKADILLLPQVLPLPEQPWYWILAGKNPEFISIPIKDTETLFTKDGQLNYTAYSGEGVQRSLKEFGVSNPTISKSAFLDNHSTTISYLLGSDSFGRDLWSRILLGTRISLAVGILSVTISLIIGILLGTLAGYWGGWVDRVIMWVISVMWSMPTLLLALAISFMLGKGFWQVFVAIGLSMWVEIARIVRGQIMSVRELPFTEAARALGFRHGRIMFRHVLPNVISPIIIVAVANFGAAVLIEAGLSFLGIGVEIPIPSWGMMISEGYTYIVFSTGKWLAFFPGLALILLVMAINLIGIGLRDALDVKN